MTKRIMWLIIFWLIIIFGVSAAEIYADMKGYWIGYGTSILSLLTLKMSHHYKNKE